MQVIRPEDTRASVRRARKHLERAAAEIAWQIEMEGWRTLGHRSWRAMLDAEYGSSAFMVPTAMHPGWQEINAPESAADETAPTHSCDGCGRGIGGRADRRYCSSACRQRAYRERTR